MNRISAAVVVPPLTKRLLSVRYLFKVYVLVFHFNAYFPSASIFFWKDQRKIRMSEVELSCLAYVKMYLHASLYPRCSVNGLLISSSRAEGTVCITDCVPLLHSHLPLALITQLALTQVDVWCAQTQQKIVGYYQANACLLDSSPNSCALKIADKIAEHFNNAVLLMIDGQKMSPGYRVPPIVMYENKDSRWTLKDKHTIMLHQWEETRSIASQLLNSWDHTLFVDFDSHLDDITKDWTNQKLNAKIMELTSPVNGNMETVNRHCTDSI